jgi:hypothetical protein
MRRSALYRLQDLRKADGSVLVDSGHQYQMNMIWHDDHAMETARLAIGTQAGVQDDVPRGRRKDPTLMCAERNEVDFVVSLVVRKFTAIVVLPLHEISRAVGGVLGKVG